MNLNRYVDDYGCYTFQDVSFNEVDNAVMSAISYVNLDGIVSKNRFHKITIGEAGKIYFEKHSKKEKQVLAVREAVKLFNIIKDTERYKNLYLYNYAYESGDAEQFSAITIEISNKLVYVSFEGTDHLVSGWKENFMLSYQFPVLSQRRAIDYVNKHFLFRGNDIILGGHSKGGNLAMVAGMYANFWVRDKIIKIYNNDGPGLLLEQISSKYYKNVENKMIHIIPNYSMVGLLLRHEDNYVVVRSARKSIYAHDMFTWVVRGKEFEKCELSSFSKALDDKLIHWLNKYDRKTREEFVVSLFDVFDKVGVYSLVDIMEKKTLIIRIVLGINNANPVTKNILKDFIFALFQCFKDVKREELISFFERK